MGNYGIIASATIISTLSLWSFIKINSIPNDIKNEMRNDAASLENFNSEIAESTRALSSLNINNIDIPAPVNINKVDIPNIIEDLNQIWEKDLELSQININHRLTGLINSMSNRFGERFFKDRNSKIKEISLESLGLYAKTRNDTLVNFFNNTENIAQLIENCYSFTTFTSNAHALELIIKILENSNKTTEALSILNQNGVDLVDFAKSLEVVDMNNKNTAEVVDFITKNMI